MTKKDYVTISSAVKNVKMSRPHVSYTAFNDGIEAVARELAVLLALDNQRFDRTKFLQACGVDTA